MAATGDVPVRLTSGGVLVVARPRTPALTAEEVRQRLERLYGGLFPEGRAWARQDVSGLHVVAGFQLDGVSPGMGSLTAWGVPVGAAGDATDEELLSVTADPERGRALLGPWVLVAEEDDGTRLVTSSDLVHTLVQCDGPDATVWATKGLAALKVAGTRLEIVPERIPEYVIFDYVLGDEELLGGTTVLAEASVVESRKTGTAVSTYWPADERFAPGAPTDARRLREALRADATRLAALPGAHLALTAGRDSTLVASCLQESASIVPTFTMGFEGFPDLTGARAVAQELGTSHLVLRGAGSGVEGARAVAKSAWTEGLDTAWNLIGSGLVWDGPSPIVWIGGNGGEIGRAFYWHNGSSPQDLVGTLLVEAATPWWSHVRPLLEGRVAWALEACGPGGRQGLERLDVLYARGRMRKWLDRTMPRPEARGLTAAFTSPEVVRTLLDIPEDSRRTGRVFDEALALGRPNLHVVARSALQSSPPPAALAAQGQGSRLQALAGRAGRVVPRLRNRPASGDLGAVLSQVPPDLTGRVMGKAWWRAMIDAAEREPRARRLIWNAVAVEALARWLDEQQ